MGPLPKIGFLLLSTLARVLPRPMSYLIGETVAVVFFLLSSQRRRRIARNLRVISGGGSGLQTRMSGLRVMLCFARGVVEIFMIPHLRSDEIETMVKVAGNEKIDKIRESGRGIVLVTAHLGSWELGGVALADRGYKITTVAGVQFTAGLSPLIKAMKQRSGITVVSAESGTLKAVRALQKGEIVALHIDGDQFMGGVEVKFFGRKTRLPRGPAALCLRTGAALVPAFAIRTGRDRVTVHIESEIPHAGGDVAAVTAKVASVVEDYVREYPEQWCIFRPFWE